MVFIPQFSGASPQLGYPPRQWQNIDLPLGDTSSALVDYAFPNQGGEVSTPLRSAAAFIAALLLHESNPQESIDALSILLERNLLDPSWEDFDYKPNGIFLGNLRDYLEPRPFIVRSYVVGSEPSQGYVLPDSLELRMSFNPYAQLNGDEAWVLVESSGSPLPRSIYMVRGADSRWRVHSHGLFQGIIEPSGVDGDGS